MKKETKRQQLESTLKDIANKLNKATSKEEAIQKNIDFYYTLDFNSMYGGYRIESVKINSGASFGAFGGNGCEPRINYNSMKIKLNTILATIQEVSK